MYLILCSRSNSLNEFQCVDLNGVVCRREDKKVVSLETKII